MSEFLDELSEFLPPGWSRQESRLQICTFPRDDLFNRLTTFIRESNSMSESPLLKYAGGDVESFGPIAALSIGPRLAVSFNRELAKPHIIQCFVAAIANAITNLPTPETRVPVPIVVDENVELTVWSTGGISTELLTSIWRGMMNGTSVDETESSTTPKLYGSKERIADFIVAAAIATVPAGASFLDLMSGTGIISRKLASYYKLTANDANPYASVLTGAQPITFSASGVVSLMAGVRPLYEYEFQRLAGMLAEALEKEAVFLHGDYDQTSLSAYRAFVSASIGIAIEGPPARGEPHRMIVSRYANAYFGVRQAAEIDSIRSAINEALPEPSPERNLLLAALLIASCVCMTGPHFAQPLKVGSLAAFRQVAERRARSVVWEFETAVRRLASRRPVRFPISPVTTLDWREALANFVGGLGSGTLGAIYLDPPYTRLQYSRYYHVLNSLILYDYPPIEGVGRYSPRTSRFSSRFEYRPGPAAREFEDVFDACARNQLTVLLSYSDRALLPIRMLYDKLVARFTKVDVFSERIRHHSQGIKLEKHPGNVTEYLLVARNT
jgi:adenine-specific DNA-methyltransferase